jgi:L-alanine-DL-glutamate epimerase-like enolase superfamily enzyme
MIEVELKTLHLTTPFRIAHGSSSTRQVVRVREGESVGEAPFVPYYHEDVEATLAWLRSGGPGKPGRAAELALDLLRCDQECRARGVPLSALVPESLPMKKAGRIAVCRSFSIPTDLKAYAAEVAETAQRFQVLKLKLGSGDLAHDREIVKTARMAAPRAEIIADVNGGWSVAETVGMLVEAAKSGLALVEQPFHHSLGIEGWQELKSRRTTEPALPIQLYADESAQNADDVALLAGLVDGVNVKLLKCGSFAGAVRMIAKAREHELGVLLGCMIESSLGITAAAHLAPWADFADLDGHLYLADDDYFGVRFDESGWLVMPEGPGIGARPH